ncbi:MAG TPA: hypothetical protein DEA90_02140 [Opitutae bacterium]|nr:hypothetical protein [Opitutae bacterium]|tara:strand:+ start:2522 stop:4327 length:1806 start_codon:yes stop_codon:yes gene_type:complete
MSGSLIVGFSLFLLSCVVSVLLGFVCFDNSSAVQLLKHAGYWWMLITFICFLLACQRQFTGSASALLASIRRHKYGLLGILLSSWLLLGMQPMRFKILMDEPVLAATALQMHLEKEVLTVSKAYNIDGDFQLLGGYVDKRPYFYPFLVSLLHDLTGYRSNQGIVLNAILTPVFMGLLYIAGVWLWPRYGGFFAMALFLTAPILSMVATGGGFDQLNLVMLLVVMIASRLYIDKPSPQSLNLLIGAGVLLAQTRYESALYVTAVGLIVALGWWRDRRIIVTKTLILAPLFMLPVALLQRAFHEDLWQLADTNAAAAFSISNGFENLLHAFNYFFSTQDTTPNSILLSILSVVAVVLFLFYWRRLYQEFGLQSMAGVAILLVGALNFLILMGYHWGALDDIVATRLVLPYLLFQVLLVVKLAGLLHWPKLGPVLLIIVASYFIFYTRPLCARTDFLKHALPPAEAQWLRERVRERSDQNILFVTNRHLIALIEQESATLPQLVLRRPQYLELHQRLRTFDDVLFVYTNHTVIKNNGELLEDHLNEQFELEVLQTEQLAPGVIITLARLVNVHLDQNQQLTFDLQVDDESYMDRGMEMVAKLLF